jgi:hypothetical protein
MEPIEVRDNERGILELGLINPRGLAFNFAEVEAKNWQTR